MLVSLPACIRQCQGAVGRVSDTREQSARVGERGGQAVEVNNGGKDARTREVELGSALLCQRPRTIPIVNERVIAPGRRDIVAAVEGVGGFGSVAIYEHDRIAAGQIEVVTMRPLGSERAGAGTLAVEDERKRKTASQPAPSTHRQGQLRVARAEVVAACVHGHRSMPRLG